MALDCMAECFEGASVDVVVVVVVVVLVVVVVVVVVVEFDVVLEILKLLYAKCHVFDVFGTSSLPHPDENIKHVPPGVLL